MNEPICEIRPIVFHTSSNQYYAYDPFSNVILTINSAKYQNVDEATAIADIHRYLEVNNICKKGRFSAAEWKRTLVDHNKAKPNTLVLQLSCRCNLACEYCIYSGNYSHMQEHHNEDMSMDTLIRSIDYFSEHSADDGKLKIAFYGGEALLCFDKIQYAVEYARNKMPSRQLGFSISSNGTTLTPAVVKWLNENPDVIVIVTVNGENHDQYRKTTNGSGSLKLIIDKLNYIKSTYPNVWQNQISCIANKMSDADNKSIMDYYKEYIGVPPEIVTKIRKEMGNQAIDDLFSDHQSSSDDTTNLYNRYIGENDPFIDAFYDTRISLVHDRILFDNDNTAYIPSCIPMATRVFVRADGSLNICERVSDQLCMGNIYDGINEPMIQTLREQFVQLVEHNCLECWAQRLCAFCFQDIIDENGNMIREMPQAWCENSRKNIKETLVLYCEIAENRFKHLQELGSEQKKNEFFESE